MQPKRNAVKIQDVAREAGVSVSTVSRVLNGKVDVAKETQDRVLGLIEKMGYTSSLAARSMRSLRTNLIGLVMPDVEHPFSIEVMKGVNRAITESPYDLLVYTTGNVRKDSAANHEQRFVAQLNNSITDGVIIVASANSEFFQEKPIVSVDPHSYNPNFPSIYGTNYAGAIDAMEYLLELGHRRIGFIAGRPELESAKQRFRGYQDALSKWEITFDESLVVNGDFAMPPSVLAARQLLLLPERPTAIFAANDQSALGAFVAAKDLGLEIPNDLSVIGFDNITEANYINLTTVDQFLSDMGSTATHMLIKIINGEPLQDKVKQFQTKLVVRGSCQRLHNNRIG
ncbi:MAG: LacI family DNA-binding transcriptional regulator [Anaerolineaceae bacterium]|nr:LacI family DNA-binding transcriptional regulator [Anaerolineaceae bacterium]